jgi:hypothetical protein
VLFGVVIVACVLVATGMILIADRVIPLKIGKEHNSTLSPF